MENEEVFGNFVLFYDQNKLPLDVHLIASRETSTPPIYFEEENMHFGVVNPICKTLKKEVLKNFIRDYFERYESTSSISCDLRGEIAREDDLLLKIFIPKKELSSILDNLDNYVTQYESTIKEDIDFDLDFMKSLINKEDYANQGIFMKLYAGNFVGQINSFFLFVPEEGRKYVSLEGKTISGTDFIPQLKERMPKQFQKVSNWTRDWCSVNLLDIISEVKIYQPADVREQLLIE